MQCKKKCFSFILNLWIQELGIADTQTKCVNAFACLNQRLMSLEQKFLAQSLKESEFMELYFIVPMVQHCRTVIVSSLKYIRRCLFYYLFMFLDLMYDEPTRDSLLMKTVLLHTLEITSAEYSTVNSIDPEYWSSWSTQLNNISECSWVIRNQIEACPKLSIVYSRR